MYINVAMLNIKPDETLVKSSNNLTVMFSSLSFKWIKQYVSMLIATTLSNIFIAMLYMNISFAFIIMIVHW